MCDWSCSPWFPEGHGMQGVRAHCGVWMWGTPGAGLASIRAPTLKGTREAQGFPPFLGVGTPEPSGSVPCGLDVGGYRHRSKSLQSEPCKKDQCWESTAPALGTSGRHLGWYPSYSLSPATCEVHRSRQMIPMCPGDSQIATDCSTTEVSCKSRATALTSAVLPC